MKRIKYKKLSKNLYQTTKPIMLGQNLVHVTINVDTKTLTIFDGVHILYNSTEKNYSALRKKARKVLKELGAKFEDEIRVRI